MNLRALFCSIFGHTYHSYTLLQIADRRRALVCARCGALLPGDQMFLTQPQHLAIYAALGQGGVVATKEIYMSDASYDLKVRSDPSIVKGQPGYFSHHVLNEYEDMSPAVAAKVAEGGNRIVAALQKQADPNGELTATLFAIVDGKRTDVPPIKLTQVGYNKAQREVHAFGDKFLADGEKHAHDKAAKKKGGKGSSSGHDYGDLPTQ